MLWMMPLALFDVALVMQKDVLVVFHACEKVPYAHCPLEEQ
jgi:hypothetical protein